MDFVHLHLHTEYSLLDGASRISRLAKTCKNLGMNACAVTDHGNMYGIYKFYKEAKKYNENKIDTEKFKPILGCEAYIVDDLKTKIHAEHIGHIVLLAKDMDGYINLCKINTKAWVDGFYKKPRIDYDFLEKHCKGLVCLSACLAGHIPYLILQGMYDEAKKYAVRLKKMFGEDFYMEIQDHEMEDQKRANKGLIRLALELDIPLVLTNDVHYLGRQDAEMQKALVCVTTKKTFDEPNDMVMPTQEFYLKSPTEMLAVLNGIEKFCGYKKGELDQAILNTVKIADKCNCSPFAKRDLIPQFTLPPNTRAKNNTEYFRMEIEKGLHKLYGKNLPQRVLDRYETEFKVIADNKFVDYFLIVADLMQYAQSRGIATGPGRGSGAGSIIAYALGITRLDPLKYNLLFERFLHAERVSMPDFDLDFCCIRRGEVIDYVIEKYGKDHVCQIITFGTMAAKASIKDIARVFKMPYTEVDKITKPINAGPQEKPPILPYVFELKTLEPPKKTAGEREIEEYHKEHDKLLRLRCPELVNLYKNEPTVKKIVDMAMKVEGFPRNCSTHAAGVIICKEIVGDVSPLQKNGDDITSQYDMKEVEELGMLKMDFLGLITLTDIQGTINDIKKHLGKDIDMYAMEYNDPEVYAMISAGDTDAVFQLESGGYKRFMKDLRPDCIEDIIAANALFRPGPMDMIPAFCSNKHGTTEIVYDHPLLEPILRDTYGQIVYQEQVMDIFRVMGGYSLGQADLVRRAMGKKDAKEMERQRDIFLHGDIKNNIKGAVSNGVPLVTAKIIFEKMEKFAGYAFNKSHAASYAYLGYQTAWLKFYYYPYYMANVLNNRVHKWDDMTWYINSIRKHNVDVLPPSINKSDVYFTVEYGVPPHTPPTNATHDDNSLHTTAIRFGLLALKHVGEGVIQLILKERTTNGKFKSFGDFCQRVDSSVLNKRVLESLILGGAFDGLGHTRSSLMTAYPNIVKLMAGQKKATDAGQLSMFGMLNEHAKIEIPNVREYDPELKLKLEKEVVGIYLSGHPLASYAELFEQFTFNTSKIKRDREEDFPTDDDIADEYPNDTKVTFGAIIAEVKKMLTKSSKQEMCVLRVEDMFGDVEIMLFPKVYEKAKPYAVKDAVIKIVGRISIREGENTIILADSIEPLVGGNRDNLAPAPTSAHGISSGGRLYLKYNTSDTELNNEIQNILRSYGGDIAVFVRDTSSGEMLAQKPRVRECQALKFELENLLGPECIAFR